MARKKEAKVEVVNEVAISKTLVLVTIQMAPPKSDSN